jgi:hypothetical protein
MARADDISDADAWASRGSWVDDYHRLSGADPAGLAAEELETLADAAWMVCQREGSMTRRQQAYVRYLETPDGRVRTENQAVWVAATK